MRRNRLFSVCILLLISSLAMAQSTTISGIVADKQSDEPIPFAAVTFRKDGRGILTDSLGKFSLYIVGIEASDTLEINSVGYKIVYIPFNTLKDSAQLTVQLEVLPPQNEAVVKSKYNRALWFWKKVVAAKPKNDMRRFDNYGYEVYNKLELDIDNVNKDKLGNLPLLKKLNFVLDYVDTTSESKPYLPVYLTETLSDFYKQRQPYRTREVIKASITNGLDNESLIKYLGSTYQNVNVYDNTIPVFDKYFVSPFADNADAFYKFKLQDTQYLNKKRLVHFLFQPKHPGANLFTGDCWVNDTSFAIQKITMRPSTDANINFITGLSIIQEYKFVGDSTWFLYKDKFVADLSPLGKKHVSFKGRKTTTYQHVLINDTAVDNELAKSKPSEDMIVLHGVLNKPDSFWQKNRHEPLNNNEQTVYKVLDTLENNKTYVRYRNLIHFFSTGVKDIGNIRIGPWYYWLTSNRWEGTRVRFDLSTNTDFSKHWYFKGYAAYGFTDKALKGSLEARYRFRKQPYSYASIFYKKDIDNGQTTYDQLSSDNLFASFLRKPGIESKYQQIETRRAQYYTETNKGFGIGILVQNRRFTPLLNLPSKELFPVKGGEPMNASEVTLHLRYAYQERTYDENFDHYTLGSLYPMVDVYYTHGFKGLLSSSYKFDKIDFTVHDYIKLTPYGELYYNFFAGKTWGTLPYQLLNIQPGNDWYYYSRNSFNLMHRFEYISDQYAGFNLEHNIGSGIFRYTKLTRKMKLRQFWEVKGVVGSLSDANKQLNFVGEHPFSSLDGKLYMEVGTGIDNIFKFFRIDCIWRVLPQPLPVQQADRFGVFFGFRLSL
ncbi:carboxypeptidase-like regulatory domain-containing protein [Ilyomonas limi]|uniref:Carboxypeptidase-like regulatory domain-containing protein n=2 Tax=Ilyomonas limi TaxID=2575867 RepID=A0A4U3KSK2_9BACT|nr:carboxypeptidase-like regulatory domain-containing protein [Ilyomonas limi]